jgi:hypothetical protein
MLYVMFQRYASIFVFSLFTLFHIKHYVHSGVGCFTHGFIGGCGEEREADKVATVIVVYTSLTPHCGQGMRPTVYGFSGAASAVGRCYGIWDTGTEVDTLARVVATGTRRDKSTCRGSSTY